MVQCITHPLHIALKHNKSGVKLAKDIPTFQLNIDVVYRVSIVKILEKIY